VQLCAAAVVKQRFSCRGMRAALVVEPPPARNPLQRPSCACVWSPGAPDHCHSAPWQLAPLFKRSSRMDDATTVDGAMSVGRRQTTGEADSGGGGSGIGDDGGRSSQASFGSMCLRSTLTWPFFTCRASMRPAGSARIGWVAAKLRNRRGWRAQYGERCASRARLQCSGEPIACPGPRISISSIFVSTNLLMRSLSPPPA
jgi:hypothetical protein